MLFTIFSKDGVNDQKKCDGFINGLDKDEIKVVVVSILIMQENDTVWIDLRVIFVICFRHIKLNILINIKIIQRERLCGYF